MLEPAYRQSAEKMPLLKGIRSRDLQLWGIYAQNNPIAGIVTRVLREATSGDLTCHLWLVGGSRLSEWAGDFIAKLIVWARSEGCAAITGNGRPGWARIVRRFGGERIADRDGLPCWSLPL